MINIKKYIIEGKKNPLISSIFAGTLLAICLMGIAMPSMTNASFTCPTSVSNATYVVKYATWAQTTKKIHAVITAYSSTPDQTDDSPFINASGLHVQDGDIANNMLPFGTKVRIPALYGDKVFIVRDRMNARMGDNRFDIWFPTRSLAIKFGVKTVEIEVIPTISDVLES
jgi:3D (Asp-Asp-Asp) domain-containing protein